METRATNAKKRNAISVQALVGGLVQKPKPDFNSHHVTSYVGGYLSLGGKAAINNSITKVILPTKIKDLTNRRLIKVQTPSDSKGFQEKIITKPLNPIKQRIPSDDTKMKITDFRDNQTLMKNFHLVWNAISRHLLFVKN